MSDSVASGSAAGVAAAAVGVVVVDHSPAQRRFLRAMIDADPELTVVGEARTGREAVALVERLRPGVVLMDLDLPVMNGIDVIECIMAVRPTPILVYSPRTGDPAGPDGGLAAIAAGAVDVVAKPGEYDGDSAAADRYADTLRRQLRVASRVRVITHPRGRLRNPPAPPQLPTPPVERFAGTGRPDAADRTFDLIAIGVSTGGPQALAVLLGALPADLAQAVLVVQHMADGFLEGLAAWLDTQCALPVRVGRSGHRLVPGTVTLAPGGQNLIVHERLRVSCVSPPPSQFHVPGIDATFASIAANVGRSAVGVILTGMGRDGAVGLKEMREHGGVTIAQDEATSAVYGMPGAAVALGAAEFERPLPEIAPLLLSLVRPPESSPR